MKHFNIKNTKLVFNKPNSCEIFVNSKFVTQINLGNDYDEVDIIHSFTYENEAFDIIFNADYGTENEMGYFVPDVVIYELTEPDKEGYQTLKADDMKYNGQEVSLKIENIEFMFEPK